MSEPCTHRWELIRSEDLYRCRTCLAQFTRLAYAELGYSGRWDMVPPQMVTPLYESSQMQRFRAAMQPINDVSAVEWWQLCE